MEKKRRMKRRGIATLLATALLVALMAIPAAAATEYETVSGDNSTCTFTKYLIVDAGDNVPNVTFEFQITPGTAIAAVTTDPGRTMEVLAGVGSPTASNVVFTQNSQLYDIPGTTQLDIQRTASERATGLDATTGVQFEAGERYAVGTSTIDFSGVSFTEPGIYRYIVTEKANATHEAAGIMHDNDVDRVLDVYVTDAGTTDSTTGKPELVVSAYVMHKSVDVVEANAVGYGSGDVDDANDPLDDKTDGFTNEYNSKDLVFKKVVSGNQASRDKYFEFTATLTNVNDNDVFTVSLADDDNANTTDGNADATPGTNDATIYTQKTNPTSVTGAQLKTGVKFYLQHGQSIAIRGIAPNATYAITENAEDYKSEGASVTGYEDPTACTGTATIGTIAGSDKAAMTSFTNTRDGIIPTGILLSATPWIILGLIVVAGIVFFAIRSRKKYEEE